MHRPIEFPKYLYNRCEIEKDIIGYTLRIYLKQENNRLIKLSYKLKGFKKPQIIELKKTLDGYDS